MPLQYKFFIEPVKQSQESEEELNLFLMSVRAVQVHREFVSEGGNSYWSIAVEHLSDGSGKSAKADLKKKGKIDYREILSPEDFRIFARLRDWRKEAAGKEAVPVYTIFTNEQLAKFAEKKITAKAGLQQIEGVGKSRVEKYGEAIIRIMEQAIQHPKSEVKINETGG